MGEFRNDQKVQEIKNIYMAGTEIEEKRSETKSSDEEVLILLRNCWNRQNILCKQAKKYGQVFWRIVEKNLELRDIRRKFDVNWNSLFP